jgi:hypothetical protein
MIQACTIAMTFFLAAPPVSGVEFDGERYVARFHSNQPEIRLIEFVRESETIDNWTKLFAIRNFPHHNSPEAAVRAFQTTVKEHNPLAGVQTLVKEDGTEAMIDFITWQEGDSMMELNVHRYLRKPGHPGLISYQFAYRFQDGPEMTAEKLRALRERWTELMRRIEPAINFSE